MAKVTIDRIGTKLYYNDNCDLHREDGPAIIGKNGSLTYIVNRLWHRENGPAVIWADGVREFFNHSVKRRIDGPVKTCPNGYNEWLTSYTGDHRWPKL